MKPAEIISVDIWDTLLRRKVAPDEVLMIFAGHLSGSAWNLSGRTSGQIFRFRKKFGLALGRMSVLAGWQGEYPISWFLRGLFLYLGNRDLKAFSAFAVFATSIDFEIECKMAYRDDGLEEFLRPHLPAGPIYFLSDYYHDTDFVGRLLREKGVEVADDSLFISCAQRATKARGGLFRGFKRAVGVKGRDWIHVGDNPHADGVMAERAGARVLNYQPDEAHARRLHRERAGRLRVESPLVYCQSELGTLEGEAEQLGLRWSALFACFAMAIVQRARDGQADDILFCTREGDFFLRCVEAVANSLPEGLMVPYRLLEISRKTTFLPRLKALTPEQMAPHWSQHYHQTPFELSHLIGVEPHMLEPAFARHGIGLYERVYQPWRSAGFCAGLADPAVQMAFVSARDQARSELMKYLGERGVSFDSPGRHVFVDIGWFGSIQDNLAALLPAHEFVGVYIGLQPPLNRPLKNSRKEGAIFDLVREYDRNDLALLSFALPMELLCGATGGTVTGYAQDESGQMCALRKVNANEEAALSDLALPFQQGALIGVRALAERVAAGLLPRAELLEWAKMAWREMLANPPEVLKEVLSRYDADEAIAGKTLSLTESISNPEILLALFDARRRQAVKDKLALMPWRYYRGQNPKTPFLLRCVCRAEPWLIEHSIRQKRKIWVDLQGVSSSAGD